jgi:hypothetical protein
MNTENRDRTQDHEHEAPSVDTDRDRAERRERAQEYADRASDPAGDIASGGGEHPA